MNIIVSFLLFLTIFSYNSNNNFYVAVTAVPSDFVYHPPLPPQTQPQLQQQQYVLEDVECIIYEEEIQVTQDIDEEEYICGLFDYDYFNKNKNKNRRDATSTDTDTNTETETETETDSSSSGISISLLVPIEYESIDIRNNLDSKRIRSGEYKMKLSRVIATTTTTTTTTTTMSTNTSTSTPTGGGGGFGGRLRRNRNIEQPGLLIATDDAEDDLDEDQASETSESIIQDYFIGYNRKANMNDGVKENPDTISIIKKESGLPNQYGRSTKKASLLLGQSYTIKDYSNQIGKDIHIEFIGLQSNGSDATIKITDVFNCDKDDECNPSNFIDEEDNYNNNIMTDNNNSPCGEYVIAIKLDQYPGDITWVISTMDDDDNDNGIISTAVAEGSGYENEFTMVERTVCLLYDENYTYTITDNFGDGLCCSNGQGYYEIYDPNNGIKIIQENGQFTNTKSNTFFIPPLPTTLSLPPSLAPSISVLEQLPEIDTIKEESNLEFNCVNNINFRYKSRDKKDCSWIKKRQSRKKWCNKDVKPSSSSSSSIDVNDNDRKKIRDHCPTVCVKECKPKRIKTCKDKNSKIKFEEKRYKCKWFSLNDKCDIKKGKKYVYEKCPL
jgi:hypothetical protein